MYAEIKDINKSPECYLLERQKDGKKISQKISSGTPLYRDDVLWIGCCKAGLSDIMTGKTTATIELTDKTDAFLELSCADSPFLPEGKRSFNHSSPNDPEPISENLAIAGLVKNMSGNSNDYSVVRKINGKTISLTVRPMSILQEGDILWTSCRSAPDNNGSRSEVKMVLDLANGEKILKCDDVPYIVEINEQYIFLNNIFSEFKYLWKQYWPFGLHDDYRHAKLVSLSVRGAGTKLSMPFLGRTGSRLVAETRDLRFAWGGGVPPYSFKIQLVSASKPAISVSDINEQYLYLKEVIIEPGAYAVELRDSQNRLLKRSFEGLPHTALPSPPMALSREAKGKNDRLLSDTIYAAWLSEQDGGAWRLEAYQLASHVSQEFYPAELLRVQLEGEL